MPLVSGSHVGPYEVTSLLEAAGWAGRRCAAEVRRQESKGKS